jgi:hypothetical protein
MWYIVIILMMTLGVFFSSKVRAQLNKKTCHVLKSKDTLQIVNDTIKPLYSKKQIEEKLKHLADTKPPSNLSFGAIVMFKLKN